MVRKRDAGGHGGGHLRPGESLRSSLQLSPEDMEYCEKAGLEYMGGHHEAMRGPGGSHCTVTMSSSDSYDTLASFTQVSADIRGPVTTTPNVKYRLRTQNLNLHCL